MRDDASAFQHPEDPGWQDLPEWGDAIHLDEAAVDQRRERQRKENVGIGEGTDVVPFTRLQTVEEMTAGYVFIKNGSQVARLDSPKNVHLLSDFRNAMAGSKHWFEDEKGKTKSRPAALAWLESPERMEADELTFRAGGLSIVPAPDSGRPALNQWVAIARSQPPANWREQAKLFEDHIRALFGHDAEAFLDWLAHIEQQPGELPHYGYVHVSTSHGTGRNWISSALTRLWPGQVAASLDLIPILDSSYNGRLAHKIMAIVDEIREGGKDSHKHANKLRSIVTEEHRLINPKYGRQTVEYNSTRWLMFSNHDAALPLDAKDRRFWVVKHDGKPREPAYYGMLYGLLKDASFISSVAEFLKQRDISGFKPGAPPPVNDAKKAMIRANQSNDDLTLRDIVDRWPVDIITNHELDRLLEKSPSDRATQYSMDEVGLRRLATTMHVGGKTTRAASIRDHERWAAAHVDEKKGEVTRYTEDEKRAAVGFAPLGWY